MGGDEGPQALKRTWRAGCSGQLPSTGNRPGRRSTVLKEPPAGPRWQTMEDSTKTDGFGPVAALRAVRKVLADRGLPGPSGKLVVIDLILRASNAAGLAWASYDSLCRNLCCSRWTVRRALVLATSRHIEVAGRGPHGAVQYRIVNPGRSSAGTSGEHQGASVALDKEHQGTSAEHQRTCAIRPKEHQETSVVQEGTSVVHPGTQTGPITSPFPSPEKKGPGRNASPDPRVKSFVDWFCQTYQDTMGRGYIVNAGKDGATVKSLLRALDRNGTDPVARLQQAARNMLADRWARQRASMGLLASQINTWLGDPDRGDQGSQGDEHRYDRGF